MKAVKEEKQKSPFTNPAVQALRTQLSAVRAKVPGTDESRQTLRSKIWSTNVVFNPPNLWLTINPNDTHDPVAQVIVGEDIDLDDFVATSGPMATIHLINIAADPYASAKFFSPYSSMYIGSLNRNSHENIPWPTPHQL